MKSEVAGGGEGHDRGAGGGCAGVLGHKASHGKSAAYRSASEVSEGLQLQKNLSYTVQGYGP